MKNLNDRTIAVLLFLTVLIALWANAQVHAGDLVYRFQSPSFNGVGTSSHYLTIENQEFTRKAEIKSKRISEEKAELSKRNNTNYQKFLDNFESRVYAEFSKQLSEALFGEVCGTTYNSDGASVPPTAQIADGGGSASNCTGTMTFNGTTMTYTKDVDNDQVVLQIDGPDGNETITLPLNNFQF
jgi:hypothetical protein|tara:strand:+ start:34 stop:585 length:552 start_codon:yes stop_codon:yes gene_type:complete